MAKSRANSKIGATLRSSGRNTGTRTRVTTYSTGSQRISSNGGRISLNPSGQVARNPRGQSRIGRRNEQSMGSFGRSLPGWLQRLLYGATA